MLLAARCDKTQRADLASRDGLRSRFWTQTQLQGVENPSSAVHRMSFTPGKSQADVETSLPLLVFLQGADNNATGCEKLSKKRLETQSVGFCTLRV